MAERTPTGHKDRVLTVGILLLPLCISAPGDLLLGDCVLDLKTELPSQCAPDT